MAEPDKRQIGDGSDNYGEAAKQMAKAAKEAGKETAKQAAVKGAEAGANAAAATVQAGVEGGKAVLMAAGEFYSGDTEKDISGDGSWIAGERAG